MPSSAPPYSIPEWLHIAQLLVALVLHAAALVCIPHAYRSAFRWWRKQESGRGLWLVATCVVAAAVRLVVAPKSLAMIFVGYRMTQEAIELVPPSHYGVGATTFYHLLFAILPHDHMTIMMANAVLSVLALPLLATVAARYFDRGWVGVSFAFGVACIPLFIRNDTSESNLVPVVFWLAGGSALLLDYGAGKRPACLLYAFPLVVLAVISRPELPLLVAALLFSFSVGRAPLRVLFGDRRVLLVLALACCCSVPHSIAMVHALSLLGESGALPAYSEPFTMLMTVLLRQNTLVRPELFPVGVVLLALAAPIVSGAAVRRRAVAVAVAAVVAVLAYFLDVDRGNMVRVHTIAALLATLLASAGAVALVDRFGRYAVVAMLCVVGVSSVPAVTTLWAPTNAAQEEQLLREVVRMLPAEPVVLVRPWSSDVAAGRRQVHFHYPDYIFDRSTRLMSIADFQQDPDWTAPVFFLRGYRCYAEHDPPPTTDANELPACRELERRYCLEPVFERDALNHGNLWIDYYTRARTFRVGLYRVRP